MFPYFNMRLNTVSPWVLERLQKELGHIWIFFFFAWNNYLFLFVKEWLGWPRYFPDVLTYHAYACFFANTTAATRVRRIRWALWGLSTFGQEWLRFTWSLKSKSVHCSVVSDFLWLHDCSPLGSSVYWVSQARILECVAIPFSNVPSRPRDWTWVSHIAGRFFTETPGKQLRPLKTGIL